MATIAAKKWPLQADVPQFFGEAGSPQATAGMAVLPFPMVVAWAPDQTVRQFRCHAKVARPFESIFRNTLAHYGEAEIRRLRLDRFGGCYNFRPIRGGKAFSMHAYGIAFDIDPERNQLKWGKDRASLARPEYVAFWNIVEAAGAISLGRERNIDWMHLQFARLS